MKFLVDAQLPQKLAIEMQAAGHDVVHTFNLPKGNATPDNEIIGSTRVCERIFRRLRRFFCTVKCLFFKK